MVKADIKTPNKRKSLAQVSPAKKVKVENDTPAKKINTPAKKFKTENDSPAKITPKVENGNHKPFTPKKQNQGPKNNQQSIQKSNKKDKQQGSAESPKKLKQFAGTKQLKKEQKPKIEKKTDAAAESQGPKKKRRNAFSTLISNVKAKEGSNDAETLKTLEGKIQAILSRGELTKTAKRKLSLLNKLKSICQDGADKTAERAKQARETQKAAKLKIKAEKPAAAPQSQQKQKKQAVKAEPKVEDDDDEDSEEEEEDSDEEESGEEVEGDSNDEVEGEEGSDDEDDDDDEEEDDDDDEDDDDSDEEEAPAPKKNPKAKQAKTEPEDKSKNIKQPSLDQLKSKEILKKGQKRFVLFVGNIPFDTTKQDIAGHFSKVGDIVDIRIPTEKGNNRPRGFAYIEVQNETAYEKCMSMHHSQLKGRRINVLYTQGGKKKGDDKKKEMKAKNMKLHAMRRQGKLAGSTKESQKRSFRRNKGKNQQVAGEN